MTFGPNTQLPIAAIGRLLPFGGPKLDAEQQALLAAFNSLSQGERQLLLGQAARGNVDYITGRDVIPLLPMKKAKRDEDVEYADLRSDFDRDPLA